MYNIAVKIDDIEKRRRSAGLLHVVIGFFLIVKGADYYKYTAYKNFLSVAPVLLVASLALFYGFFRKKLDQGARFNSRLRILELVTFLVLGIALISAGRTLDYLVVFVFALLCLLLFFSERTVFEESYLVMDEKGVTVPGSYRSSLVPWTDLAEVIVREDFITLFHVKKKYLQFQVMQDLSTLEIAKMNAFCREETERTKELSRNVTDENLT